MNELYAKTILYAYPHLTALAEQIDELVEKRALASMTDYSPALEQFNKIIDLTEQKTILFKLEIVTDKILKKFTETELDYLDYKYFKRKAKEYYEGFDASSRTYFRRQIRLAERFALALEKQGITDKVFEEKCLSCEFFSALYKRVVERENSINKTKETQLENYGISVKNLTISKPQTKEKNLKNKNSIVA